MSDYNNNNSASHSDYDAQVEGHVGSGTKVGSGNASSMRKV
jgi:hypothetical protein